MSEGDQSIGEKLLEECEIKAELTTIADRNLLPRRIVQKVTEKLMERKIKLTKNQLYKLVEKIQNLIQTSSSCSPSQNQLELVKRQWTQPFSEGSKKPVDNTVIQSTDMKKLVDMVERLNERLKAIEERHMESVKGVTGKLIKTKDMKMIEPLDVIEEDLQPLARIPTDPESIVVIMKWLQYLVDRIGKNNLAQVLCYYVDIGWISDDVRLDLIDYSKGITEEPVQTGTHPQQLPTRDHFQSLLFIQKLKGLQLDDRFLYKIEREMEKMAKSLEGYQLR